MIMGEHWYGAYWIFAECGKVIDLMSRLFLFPEQWQRHTSGKDWIVEKITPQLGNMLAAILWFAKNNGFDIERVNHQCSEKMKIYDQWKADGFCQGVFVKNLDK